MADSKKYPQEIAGCLIGEFDWIDEWLDSGGTVEELMKVYEQEHPNV